MLQNLNLFLLYSLSIRHFNACFSSILVSYFWLWILSAASVACQLCTKNTLISYFFIFAVSVVKTLPCCQRILGLKWDLPMTRAITDIHSFTPKRKYQRPVPQQMNISSRRSSLNERQNKLLLLFTKCSLLLTQATDIGHTVRIESKQGTTK